MAIFKVFEAIYGNAFNKLQKRFYSQRAWAYRVLEKMRFGSGTPLKL